MKSKMKRHSSRKMKGGAIRLPSEFYGKQSNRYSDNYSPNYNTAYGPSKGVSHGSVSSCGRYSGPNLGPMQMGGKRKRMNRRKLTKRSRVTRRRNLTKRSRVTRKRNLTKRRKLSKKSRLSRRR